MLYKDTINGAEIQTNFLEIIDEARAIVEPSNVDTTVSKINNLILSAAEPCKVTSRQTIRNVTRRKNVSPWYDENVKNNKKYTIRYVINMQDLRMMKISWKEMMLSMNTSNCAR